MKGKIIKFPSRNRKKKILLAFVISLIFIYNAFCYYSLAKYNTQTTGNVEAKIASPIIEVEGEEQKQITVSSPDISYGFKIKNYNEMEEVNEVNMKYYIEIVSEKLEFLDIQLYKGGEEIILTNYKTEEMELIKEEKQTDNYHLDVKLKENIEENIQAKLEIKVCAIQEK